MGQEMRLFQEDLLKAVADMSAGKAVRSVTLSVATRRQGWAGDAQGVFVEILMAGLCRRCSFSGKPQRPGFRGRCSRCRRLRSAP